MTLTETIITSTIIGFFIGIGNFLSQYLANRPIKKALDKILTWQEIMEKETTKKL